jgi:hypothetical protein
MFHRHLIIFFYFRLFYLLFVRSTVRIARDVSAKTRSIYLIQLTL